MIFAEAGKVSDACPAPEISVLAAAAAGYALILWTAFVGRCHQPGISLRRTPHDEKDLRG
jgi:hypothetical protein